MSALGRHLLSIDDLGRSGIEGLLEIAASFAEVVTRDIPKVPALKGRMVATLFAESSTRTRSSFETAAKRLSADVLSLTTVASSMAKGESVKDTVRTLRAIGADALVVRHPAEGVPVQVARWTEASVVNAGDGCHEHPTQALLDCFTLQRHFGGGAGGGGGQGFLEGARVAIVGDILHSRVARSCTKAFVSLGARVTLAGPKTLLPTFAGEWPAELSCELEPVLYETDVLYLLRMQRERGAGVFVPSEREFAHLYGIDERRLGMLAGKAVIMHPGPVNRGVEMTSAVADSDRSLALDQVHNGVAVRMAVLYLLVAGGGAVGKEADGGPAIGAPGFPGADR